MKTTLHALFAALALGSAGFLLTTGCTATRSSMGGHVDPSTGDYVDDAAITTKVEAALQHDQLTSTGAIHVGTSQGVVQLTGSVESQQGKTEATDVSKQVPGVRGVENYLAVQPTS